MMPKKTSLLHIEGGNKMFQNKDPYDMENMKKLLQNISNDMVDLKRTNNDNQVNNISLARLPFRRPY